MPNFNPIDYCFFLSTGAFRALRRKAVFVSIGCFVALNASCSSEDSSEPEPIVAIDTDGDGIFDADEILNGTNKNNPCDPKPSAGYTGYDATNTTWLGADCDTDGITNAQELSDATDPYFNTLYAKPEFLPKLSDLQIFEGNPADLKLNTTAHKYRLTTPLFSDYSHKFRSISLPKGTQMTYDGEGLLVFPDNTVISKSFYYFKDERDPSLGKQLIETRLLIKQNGVWNMGNYIWNDIQTEAFLSEDAPRVSVDWVDSKGQNRSVDYKIPFSVNCTQCHNVNDVSRPIGPKARNLNVTFKGINQLQYFIDQGLLANAPGFAQIESIPNWADASKTIEDRTRAYLDVNCAHCHQPGGQQDANIEGRPDLRFETSFGDSNIFAFKEDIKNRVDTTPGFGPAMPQIGITQKHTEGVALIHEYIDSLE